MMTVFTVAETLIIMYMFDRSMQSRESGKRKFAVFAVTFAAVSVLSVAVSGLNTIIKTLITLVVLFLASGVLFKNPWYQRIFCVLLVSYELVVCDIITSNLLTIAFGSELERVVEENTALFALLGILSKLFALAVVFISTIFIKRIDFITPAKYWVILDMVLSLVFVTNLYFIRLDTFMVAQKDYIDITVMCSAYMIITILMYYMFLELGRYYMRKSELTHEQLQREFLEKQLAQRKSAEKEMSVFRHDIKNHLASLRFLYSSGKTEEFEQYFDKLMDIAATPLVFKATGIPMLDAVIEIKKQTAAEHGIEIKVESQDVKGNVSIDDHYFTSIFANLLDNAIEAADTADNKQIEIQVAADESELKVRLQNYYSDKSTAPIITDHIHRGLGTHIIKSAVDELGGSYVFAQRDGIYVSDIIIPLKE